MKGANFGSCDFRVRPDPFSSPVNLGGSEEVTVGELANLVIELTRSSSVLIPMYRRADDPMQRKPDLRVANQHLGWSAKIGLREGVGRYCEHIKSLKGHS